jgi:hypothetical protein
MKYFIFVAFSMGLATAILLLSLWRQGQVSIFPHATFASPTVAPSTSALVIPDELLELVASYDPSILPLQPLYLPKMLWQRLELIFPRTKSDQQALLLDRAQERMMIALYLWQKRAPQNADANVLKSQQYLLQAVQVDTDSELQRIKDVQLKHASILNLLEGSSPLVSQAQALNQLVESLMQP